MLVEKLVRQSMSTEVPNTVLAGPEMNNFRASRFKRIGRKAPIFFRLDGADCHLDRRGCAVRKRCHYIAIERHGAGTASEQIDMNRIFAYPDGKVLLLGAVGGKIGDISG